MRSLRFPRETLPRMVAAVALAAGAGAGASAATLGRLFPQPIGASATAVVPCDANGVAISYLNEFDALTETYRTVQVGLGDLATRCEGLPFRLTLSSSTAVVRDLTGTISLSGGTRQEIALSPPIDSASFSRAALVITG